MTYQELRKLLRAKGFINPEIAILHHRYLALRAIGVPDSDMLFDRDHGVLVHQRSKHIVEAHRGSVVAVDCDNHTALVRGKP